MSEDTVYRQDAIDAVCMEWCGVKHQDCEHPFNIEKDDYYWCDGCETALRTLPDLPSAQPKRGKWNKVHWKAFRCSECNGVSEYFTNYCPNCGADMREGEA